MRKKQNQKQRRLLHPRMPLQLLLTTLLLPFPMLLPPTSLLKHPLYPLMPLLPLPIKPMHHLRLTPALPQRKPHLHPPRTLNHQLPLLKITLLPLGNLQSLSTKTKILHKLFSAHLPLRAEEEANLQHVPTLLQ